MIVAFDNTFLTLVFSPMSIPRPDPATGKPTLHCMHKIDALIADLNRQGTSIIVPTPCLAEMLVGSPDAQKAIKEIEQSSVFRVEPFDQMAAIELALVMRRAKASGKKKAGLSVGWQQVKFDRQIVAIAKTKRATILYTDDDAQSAFAEEVGLKVKHTWDLELPYPHNQPELDF